MLNNSQTDNVIKMYSPAPRPQRSGSRKSGFNKTKEQMKLARNSRDRYFYHSN